MPITLSPDWLARFADAIQDADAQEALARATGLLAELGVEPAEASAASPPWLQFGDDLRTLAFAAQEPLDATSTATLTALLRAAMARASDDDRSRSDRERLEMLSSASFEGIMIHQGGVIIDANQRLAELLGYDRSELLGPDTMRRCVAPEDLPGVLKRMADRYEGEYVITGIRKDGSRFRAELQSKQGYHGGHPVRVVAVRDVTQRERTHTMLRESEKRIRDLMSAAFDFTVFSRDGIIVEVEGAHERVLGLTRDQIVGQPVLNLTAPAFHPLVRQIIAENRVGQYEAAAVTATGEVVPVQAVVVATSLNGANVRAAALRDLRPARRLEAERRALEQQVERAQRLNSLGILAGGIAHDFNNLLAGVMGNADFLRDHLTADEDREAAQAIVTSAQRAAALTRQMLAYAGQRDLGRRQTVDIGQILVELRALLDATLSKKAQLELDIHPGSLVRGDRTTIGQVLMNLLTNASDALGDRPGRIEVRTRLVHQPDARWDHAQGAVVSPGDWVLIEVRDTGAGMDEATRGRVFEPFFTTKEKGHGLGLAACLGIVQGHGGAVLVESVLGQGSCFSVLLPASLAPDTASESRRQEAKPHPCKVLIVDDEALVRGQVRRSLELRGYSVAEADDGVGALAALESRHPDVMILDMTMPDIDGAEVLRRVRATGSRVPVVVSSGYLDVTIERRLPAGEFQAFLSKPYSANELVDAIQQALGAPART